MKLWKKGLLIVIIGGLINTILMKNGIGGIGRELARLSILIGFAIFFIGLFRRKLPK